MLSALKYSIKPPSAIGASMKFFLANSIASACDEVGLSPNNKLNSSKALLPVTLNLL